MLQNNINEPSVIDGAVSMERLLGNIPGIVYQFKIDANGVRSLPYASPTTQQHIGLSSEEVMSDVEKWFSLTHPEDLISLENSIEESMMNLSTWEWVGRFVVADNDVRWLHGTSTPVRTDDGAVIWDGVFVDVTERKKAEQE